MSPVNRGWPWNATALKSRPRGGRNWAALVTVGIAIYFLYGRRHSRLRGAAPSPRQGSASSGA